jgi:hypothetical protein
MLCLFREAISTIVKESFIQEDTTRKELTRRCIIAVTWFLASVILAIEIPDIGKNLRNFLTWMVAILGGEPPAIR